MDFQGWLFQEITISRSFSTHIFYIFLFLLSMLALILAKKFRLFRFSLLLWLCATVIGLVWESALFASGNRQYSFWALAELLYHALTEGGPGLVIMTILADRIGLVNLSEYKEKKREKCQS
ncbi:hypothetical protein AMJ44_00660 [candidate division WOR-1 bacterium DG_54_3]|uniref:Uncharacterized protein n=1 Tax=candidate division WOR-1 bacterium DG_54_3 TaxID=1703775 RepID=A0A0S7Y5Z2_UNCSA|nr:MAG: hypothetical protein AMJ44_00660 [candidate division WOR-1 bacterium DG_54_3]